MASDCGVWFGCLDGSIFGGIVSGSGGDCCRFAAGCRRARCIAFRAGLGGCVGGGHVSCGGLGAAGARDVGVGCAIGHDRRTGLAGTFAYEIAEAEKDSADDDHSKKEAKQFAGAQR